MLKGKLTYILAVIAILWGVVGMAMGYCSTEVGMAAIWSGLTAFGVRRAISG